MKTAEQAASECGNAMCEKYGMTIDYSIPCEEAFLMGVEFGRKDEGKNYVEPINNKQMKTIKFILFIEFIALFVCGACHLVAFFTKTEFPLSMYWIIPTFVLVCCLLVIFIIAPIGEWFLS